MKRNVTLLAATALLILTIVISLQLNRPQPAITQSVLGVSTTSAPLNPELELINKIRRNFGFIDLVENLRIKEATLVRLYEINSQQSYAHQRSNGTTFNALLPEEMRARAACENLQLQYGSSLEAAVDAWMLSESHRNCLLNPELKNAALSFSEFSVNVDNSFEKLYVFAFIATE